MSVFIPADLMVEATRALATSALPDAPVQPDDDRPRRITGLLRRLVNRPRRTEPACAEPTERPDHRGPAVPLATVIPR
jgi:hypothetical protein